MGVSWEWIRLESDELGKESVMNKTWIVVVAVALGIPLAVLIATAQPPGPGRPWEGFGWEHFTERHDLDGDGLISAEEWALSHPMFQGLDQDENGVVTEEEFEAARQQADTKMAAGVLRFADQDRDGEITADEWETFLDAVDPDGDGVFQIADLTAVIPERQGGRRGGPGGPQGFGGPPQRDEFLANTVDWDDDGVLERSDLEAIFAELDANGDGILQADELPRGRFGPGYHHGFRGPRNVG
jgi:Ca2+-binding EF-hand superfamily protein